jgi:hypothetical protein
MLNALDKQTTRLLRSTWQVVRDECRDRWREIFEHLAYCGA